MVRALLGDSGVSHEKMFIQLTILLLDATWLFLILCRYANNTGEVSNQRRQYSEIHKAKHQSILETSSTTDMFHCIYHNTPDLSKSNLVYPHVP